MNSSCSLSGACIVDGARRNRLLCALACVLVSLAGCEPEPPVARGPSSAPIERIEATRLFLGAGSVSGQPLLEERSDGAEQMPEPEQLLAAFESVLPADASVALLADSAAGDPIAIVVGLPLAQFRPTLLWSENGTDGVNALTEGGAAVVIGSPFVAEFSPLQPLGLLQVDGRVLNPLQPHGYTRVLGFGSDGIGVVGRSAFHHGLFESALQAGPGIVEQGKLDISTRELKLPAYFRTFLVNCGPQVFVGASTRPINLRTLGQALLADAAKRQVQCDEAVNLSGDREVLLALRKAEQGVAFGNPRVRKTALIGFVRRTES